jgi:hypothetical protein
MHIISDYYIDRMNLPQIMPPYHHCILTFTRWDLMVVIGCQSVLVQVLVI